MVGRTVLQYQFIEKLGAGGMGEVYKARDTRLNRFVAVKVLSAGMSADPEFRRRFIQEAQAASALNHPNIITIYDVVQEGDAQYMVVEFVDGKTLLDSIPKDGMPVQLALRYATQMAEALCVAHAAGIIHRDLKPANIMVTAGGLVKLLDFGLAKRFDWTPSEDNGETAAIIHSPLTMQGSIMGTANYMSPEQAEGKRIDARSDIFSFGAVLYEMLTGRSAFRGGSVISTLSAVLRDDVQPITDLASGVPMELEQVIVRCLLKDPDQRFQTMEGVRDELVGVKRQIDTGLAYSPPTIRTVAPPPPPDKKPRKVPAVLALLLLAAAGGSYWWMVGNRPVARPSRNEPRVTSGTRDTTPKAATAPEVPPVPVDAGPTSVVLRDGLPVHLTLAEDIPADAAAGDAVRLNVADNVQVSFSVGIPKGAAAVGSIVDGAKKKMLVFGGKMTFRLEQVVAVDGQKIGIRATQSAPSKGVSKRPVTAGAHKTKGVASPAGTAYVGYVDGTQTVLLTSQRTHPHVDQ